LLIIASNKIRINAFLLRIREGKDWYLCYLNKTLYKPGIIPGLGFNKNVFTVAWKVFLAMRANFKSGATHAGYIIMFTTSATSPFTHKWDRMMAHVVLPVNL
jgi:hypothetical protein